MTKSQLNETGCYVRLLNDLFRQQTGIRVEDEVEVATVAEAKGIIRSDCYVNSVWDYMFLLAKRYSLTPLSVTYIRYDGYVSSAANVVKLQRPLNSHFVAGPSAQWYDSAGRTWVDYRQSPVIYSAFVKLLYK